MINSDVYIKSIKESTFAYTYEVLDCLEDNICSFKYNDQDFTVYCEQLYDTYSVRRGILESKTDKYSLRLFTCFSELIDMLRDNIKDRCVINTLTIDGEDKYILFLSSRYILLGIIKVGEI